MNENIPQSLLSKHCFLYTQATNYIYTLVLVLYIMPGEYHQLDKDEWKEIPDRCVHKSGNVYAGKMYADRYDVRVFVRKIKED